MPSGGRRTAPRLARCGHEVPWHGGPSRKACDACCPGLPLCHSRNRCARCRRSPRFCALCKRKLGPGGIKFCDERCRRIAAGLPPDPFPLRTCELSECEVRFRPAVGHQRFCSPHHSKLDAKRRYNQRRPARERAPWNDRKRDAYHRRRALKKGAATGAPVRLEEIAERDGWRCQLCGRKVNQRLVWPHLRSASLDHIVPLSVGGAHDPANVQLVHLTCNSEKGNRARGEQLRLIG